AGRAGGGAGQRAADPLVPRGHRRLRRRRRTRAIGRGAEGRERRRPGVRGSPPGWLGVRIRSHGAGSGAGPDRNTPGAGEPERDRRRVPPLAGRHSRLRRPGRGTRPLPGGRAGHLAARPARPAGRRPRRRQSGHRRPLPRRRYGRGLRGPRRARGAPRLRWQVGDPSASDRRGCRRLHPRSGRGRTRAARAVRARRWSPARGWRCRDGRADDRRGTGGGGEADTGPRRRSERMSEQAVTAVAEGPYFDELAVGQVFDSAPGVTLTPGLAGVHQSIVGDRLALPLDAALCAEVTGGSSLAHPALVWDLAIGQSTVATHHVKANLFYRGLVFRRTPVLGDTLRTTTEVVALRQNRPREGRRPTGLAALRITTVDQHDRPVLDFWRC